MGKVMKRTIAIVVSVAVALGVLIAVFVEHNREETEDERLPALSRPIVLGTSDPKLAHILADAVGHIHAALGPHCPVFRIDSERAQIQVSWFTDVNPCGRPDTQPRTKHMSYYVCPDGRKHIVVRDITETDKAVLDMAHELGHLLRLKDEDIGGSIMNQPPQYDLWPRPTLTPKDREAIVMRLGCP